MSELQSLRKFVMLGFLALVFHTGVQVVALHIHMSQFEKKVMKVISPEDDTVSVKSTQD